MKNQIISAFSITKIPAAGFSARGFKFGFSSKVEKGPHTRIGLKYHIAATAAVPAIGSTAWNKFLSTESDGTVPAISGFYNDVGFIDEHKMSCELCVVSHNPELKT